MSVCKKLAALLREDAGNLEEVIEHIGFYQSRFWMSRTLEQYELFKLAMERPGHIVELGVYKGESLMNWARFLETFCMGERETRVIGFDNFSGFTRVHRKDRTAKNRKDKGPLAVKKGGFNPGTRAYRRLLKRIEIFEQDHYFPSRRRIELVAGDIEKTVPAYVKDNPGLRISLLHLDCDVYEPTLIGLNCLYPHVVAGGVVVLDEYAQEKFAGESAAFDDYFAGHRPVVRKSLLTKNPSAYFIKEA